MHKSVVAGALLLMSIVTSVQAHDARGLAVTAQSDVAAKEIASALDSIPLAESETRSVLANLRLWPTPRAISVCFIGGSDALRLHVLNAMERAWPLSDLTGGRLRFDPVGMKKAGDCRADKRSDVKVAFQKGQGYWSYVGLESRLHSPSMNLEFDDQTPVDADFDRFVAHETGHAIGLEHEHQSPAIPDCKWNFKYIYEHYSWKSQEDMHANFGKMHDYIVKNKHAYIFSLPDLHSIMFYHFEPAGFTDGTSDVCYIQQNLAPSSQDLRAVRVAYSKVAARPSQRSVADVINNGVDSKYKAIRALAELSRQVASEH